MNEHDRILGEHLRILRRKQGMTQEELAKRTARSVDTIRRWENGTLVRPRLTTLQTMAEALGVRPSELIDPQLYQLKLLVQALAQAFATMDSAPHKTESTETFDHNSTI